LLIIRASERKQQDNNIPKMPKAIVHKIMRIVRIDKSFESFFDDYLSCEYFVSDDSSWLRDAIHEVHGLNIDDPFRYLGEKIREDVKFIRTYHGCKPIDFAPYHEVGLAPLAKEEFFSSTTKLFEEFGVTESMIQQAMKDISTEYREGRTWFVLDDRSFFEGAGHYLVYGGELLQSVAGHIQRHHGKPVHNHLEESGVPTVFVCDIPIEYLSDRDIWELSGTILENYFEIIFEDRKNSHGLNFGFAIKRVLPPKNIMSHYHPKEIENPIFGRIIYRPKVFSCEYCKL